MAVGDIIALRVEGLTATGSGLSRDQGRPVFADFTAPGDLVRLRITEEQKNWSRGEVLEILEAAPERTKAACPLYGICGGCNFQHLSYEAQLKAKEHIVRESFSRIGGIAVPEIKVYPSPEWEYRNRVQFHCVPDKRGSVGFRGKKSAVLIPLNDCPTLDPGIRDALRNPEKKRLIPPPQKDRFTVYSKSGVFLSEGGTERARISLGKGARQRELLVDAGVFFQSNSAALELLLEDLADLAMGCDSRLPLADIYSGVGTFAAFLGEHFSGAELIEENKAALSLARENAQAKDYRYYGLAVDDWIKKRRPLETAWGLCVVDPPRTGLSPGFRRFAAGSTLTTMAYVSCDPVTLARDSKELTSAGFTLKTLTLYDFYPQTSHIEGLAVFCR